MSARQIEPQIAAVHPRETTALSGHREAELALLNAYRSGRIPHAWLIGGAQGIGKATLAYRMARFVLAHRDALAADVQRAETLWVDPSDPVARHVAGGAHGGLLTLERSLNDKGVMRTVITVDETRETISFFGSTAAVEGWRVCIVDTVDELNANVPSRQSRAGAGSADDSVALPQIGVAAARRRGRHPGRGAGRQYRDR